VGVGTLFVGEKHAMKPAIEDLEYVWWFIG
jgi:hypothetical protein